MKRRHQKDPAWYADLYGLMFHELLFTFLGFVIFAPLLLCVAGVDPPSFIIPKPNGILQKGLHLIVRMSICSLAVNRMATAFTAHIIIITLMLHENACIDYLKTYKPNKTGRSTQPESGDMWINGKKRSQFHGKTDLELYQIIHLMSKITKEYSHVTAMLTMGPGFFMSIMCNYVVVMLHGKIPFLLYQIIGGFAIGVVATMMLEMPLSGKKHSTSKNLINYWKGMAQNRRAIRYKSVHSLQPRGLWVGPFFVIEKETFSDYFHGVICKTIDAILML